jgi:hypothetical protein
MTFGAPWGRELKVMTAIGLGVVGVPIVVQLLNGVWVAVAVLTAILAAIAVFCVRGYEVKPGELRIRRLFFDTRWPLDEGSTAVIRPYAMRGSWRTWGNGGLFAITGRFSGSGLGRYHAFVTDPVHTIVITTRRGIVVVSPDGQQAFVEAIAAASRRSA